MKTVIGKTTIGKTTVGKIIVASVLPVFVLMGCEEKAENDRAAYNDSTPIQSSAETSPAPKPGSTLEKRIAEYENVKNTVSNNEPNSQLNQRLHDDGGANTQAVPLSAAHYEKIYFKQDSSQLSEEARDDLKELSDSLEEGIPSYVTIRAQDEDNIEATDPSPKFSEMTKPRVEAIREQLVKHKINVVKVVVDEAGYIENRGEGAVMAKPEDGDTTSGDVQYIVIAFEESETEADRIQSSL